MLLFYVFLTCFKVTGWYLQVCGSDPFTVVSHLCVSHQVGILFDVDGVLLRGGSVIPAALRAFRKLVDKDKNFLLPVVFVTNAGSCQRHHKAAQLSYLLDVQVGHDRTPLLFLIE